MFNAEKPSLDALPSSAQLIRSTVIAAVSAVAILVAVVLPAEYGIDPTGAGRVLGLTEMGEIKQELFEEAEKDKALHSSDGHSSSVLDEILSVFVGAAYAQDTWRDELSFSLAPGEAAEIKLVMEEGDSAQYAWITDGGRINFDLHAHGDGQSVTYEKGRGVKGAEGAILAPFAGDHGWFWRNRDKVDVIVTLQLSGDYAAVKQE